MKLADLPNTDLLNAGFVFIKCGCGPITYQNNVWPVLVNSVSVFIKTGFVFTKTDRSLTKGFVC